MSAQINIAIVSPAPDSPQDEQMTVVAAVTSSSELTSVQAVVGARTVALTSSLGHWSGTISLAGLPRATHELVVTATNAAAQTQQATRAFIFDKAPVLTVTSPAKDTLGQPDLVRVQRGGQTIRRPRTLPPFSRLTINIEDEAPALANAAVSTRVDSGSYPIVSDRAMY